MRISANYTNYNNYTSPAFSSWQREVYKTQKNGLEKILIHRNDTAFCRYGFCNEVIYKHVIEKFKDVDKVNTYFWGCSNGSEVYTFLNEMLAKYGIRTIDKFTPIIALDYDPVAVQKAQEGCFPVENFEVSKLEEYHGKKITENFQAIYNPLDNRTITHIIPKQELKDCVKFKLGDITKDTGKMKSKNNLVFARNLWPYLNTYKIEEYARNLYKNMGKNSLLVIGDYDIKGLSWFGIISHKIFTSVGFKPTNSPIIFEK